MMALAEPSCPSNLGPAGESLVDARGIRRIRNGLLLRVAPDISLRRIERN